MRHFKKFLYHPIKNLFAKYYLVFLRKFTSIKVVGITGSAGKTTTKEMIASVLKLSGSTVYSKDNIDPVYNIATTILRCNLRTKYLVLEMGIEKPGEMNFYMWLVKPDIGVITNIFPTHTEFLGNIEGVLNEKSILVKNTNLAVLNKNDQRLLFLGKGLKSKVYWFNKTNESATETVCKILNISENQIKKGLKSYQKPNHRLKVVNHQSGAVIFDDSYNSNPEAFLFSLKKFLLYAKNNKKVAVVGDMLELGAISKSEHLRIAKNLAKYKFEKIIGVGNLVNLITKNTFLNYEKALPEVKKYLKPGFYIFIKGSRSIGLDKLIDRL